MVLDILSLFIAGELVGVGKDTSQGNGQIELIAL